MSERQEKVWVVMKQGTVAGWLRGNAVPSKVFDDRQDARDYAKRMNSRSVTSKYSVKGVKKG